MHGAPRAQRFSIATPVFWRQRGNAGWSEGVSVNASRSGVLFRADHSLAVGTELELIFGLSWEVEWARVADVICFGRIVRADASSPEDARIALAATIDRYTFIPET